VAKEKLQLRKQELVRDAIYDAAIDLFEAKGFDETTVEEVSLAAGVSRRSFFRYYATKDDLLAQSVVQYGSALTAAIETCPATLSLFETIQETVFAGIKHTSSAQVLNRRIIQIAQHLRQEGTRLSPHGCRRCRGNRLCPASQE
jgi:AcrR family transcriptional regulator